MAQTDFEELEVYEINDPSNGIRVFQEQKALLDTQIVTAKRFPRILKRCIDNAITIVTLDKQIAESCVYTLKKGKVITGPSVYLARILAREFGNMRVENAVVGYDNTHVTCMAMCFDLERNYAVRTTIKKAIAGYSEDLKVITGNAGNAIAFRNAVFAVIPQQVVNKVLDAAKATIVGDVSDANKLTARRTLVFEGLKQKYADFNLTDSEICQAVGKTLPDHITSDDIVALAGIENTLATGEQNFEAMFRPQQQKERPKPPTSEVKNEERVLQLIKAAAKLEDLKKHEALCKTNTLREAYDVKFKELKK